MRKALARFADTWLRNPIFRKELRIGLRERRFLWMQMIYLGLACLVTLYSLRDLDTYKGFYALTIQGGQLRALLILMQIAVVFLITPALASGAIASERERNNLDLLVVGGARPAQIVAGKLLHALLVSGLLLLAGLPMAVLGLTLGGSTFRGILWEYFSLGCLTLVLLLFGLMVSAREKRSGYATTQTYGLLAVLVFGGLWLLSALGWDPDQVSSWFPDERLRGGLIAMNLAFLAGFLFLKTLHHLNPCAQVSRRMGWLFLAWYAMDALALGAVLEEAELSQGDPGTAWCALIVADLLFLGCFLNVPSYPSRRQREEFRRYPGSRWYFWVLVLAGGGALAAWRPLEAGATPVTVECLVGLAAFFLVTTAACTRALDALIAPRVPFRLTYFCWLGTMFGVAAVGLLGAIGKPVAPLWSAVYLSPIYAMLSLVNPSASGVSLQCLMFGRTLPLAVPALLFHGLAAIVLGGLAVLKGKAPARPPASA